METQKKFYTVKELCSMLHLTRQTVASYIREGKLNAIKLGKSYLVSEEAYKQFIENASK